MGEPLCSGKVSPLQSGGRSNCEITYLFTGVKLHTLTLSSSHNGGEPHCPLGVEILLKIFG